MEFHTIKSKCVTLALCFSSKSSPQFFVLGDDAKMEMPRMGQR